MLQVESGIVRGYGGIWNTIEYPADCEAKKAAEPKKVFKYEAVLDYDAEDMALNENFHWLPRKDAKKKYFRTKGGTLYKLVNPEGELFSWMNGVDPIKDS